MYWQAMLFSDRDDQDVQKRARQEVLDVLGDEPLDVWPTLEQLKEFPYLTRIMKEVYSIKMLNPLCIYSY
jgi:hypothetical protein